MEILTGLFCLFMSLAQAFSAYEASGDYDNCYYNRELFLNTFLIILNLIFFIYFLFLAIIILCN